MLIVWAILATNVAFAQIPTPGGNGSDPAAKTEKVADPLGRDTPAGMVTGFISAAAEQNYEKAAQYLDLSQEKGAWGPSVAQQLQRILDQGGYVFSRLRLSSEPAGDVDDGLPPDQDKFGAVRTSSGSVDLIAQQVTDKDGNKIWMVSSRTVAELPSLSRTVISSVVDRLLPYSLRDDYRFAGVPAGHWIAVLVLAVVSFLLVWAIISSLLWVVFRIRNRQDSRIRRVLSASAFPIRLFFTVWMLRVTMVLTGVSIVARQHMSSVTEIIGWIALSWIIWRVVDAVGDFTIARMTLRGRLSMLSAVTFVRRAVKFALVAFAVIAGLNALGYNVTAGLAALGIGGIAIALGAQKTIEHLVGSLTLVTDQPMRVGDFCKFGETLGTIEDIGMRSTRIRTLDRTLITVPNGNLAALPIENFSRRDKFWYHPTLDLRYETTPDQLRTLMASMRDLLVEHPKVESPGRVRMVGFGPNSLKVEIFSYIHAVDMDEFLEAQEELSLRLMELVEEAGTGFALASQTLYLARDRALSMTRSPQLAPQEHEPGSGNGDGRPHERAQAGA
ncbi:mechanosensitive ion channel family protein [Rhodopseudomonas sp. HC1]|uniref:mechanosensitive ion channel family protein n=1 Tax=Rhodopseudomonas infernalis TaxID=2897386 RepID=UPI001EE99900|nr:mechanosensitive ion channel family protein [Rhodopseudomonas infernalis]MCG6207344.1 mechanosensitive ion channel family protein [Rhodopseudomonas infernalis]